MENENIEKKEQSDDIENLNPKGQLSKEVNNKTYVYPIRDWKEYLGESFLIIFSVLLALIVTEYLNKLHEKDNTRGLLRNIIVELNHNKKALLEMHEYNLHVLSKIDSVLIDKNLQAKLVSNDEFHLNVIAPHGILYRYFDKEAWTVAINNNIMSKIDIETVSVLTKLYEDQDEIGKLEDEVARIIFSRASRDPNQVHQTLILIKDIYHGWAVDRGPGLLYRIETAISKIESKELK
jgi:hypothetical protein